MSPLKSILVMLALLSALFISGCASKPMPRGIAGPTVPTPPTPASATMQTQIPTAFSIS